MGLARHPRNAVRVRDSDVTMFGFTDLREREASLRNGVRVREGLRPL